MSICPTYHYITDIFYSDFFTPLDFVQSCLCGVTNYLAVARARSCTPWPHLQRINSYLGVWCVRTAIYAPRSVQNPFSRYGGVCTRSSEEELSDTFHRYGARHSEIAIICGLCIDLLEVHKRETTPRSIGCEKFQFCSAEREKENRRLYRHVSRLMNALLIACCKCYCSNRLSTIVGHVSNASYWK